MTYFDRNMELTDAAVREILTVLGESDELQLETPFTVQFQTGQSANIVAVRKTGECDVEFVTTERVVPVARLEVESLLLFVDDVVTPRLFGNE